MKKLDQDVTILGGGLAGLTFALQCRKQLPEAKVTVLEKLEHPVREAAFKVGESTVEVAANYFAEVLGLREHIEQEQLPKLGLRFFFPYGDNSRIEMRRELGGKRYAPCPSYQLDRGRFENFLGEQCREREIEFLDQATIKDMQVGRGNAGHRVQYARDGVEQELSTRWLIDASGRRAFLKRKLGLQKEGSHIGNAAWFRIDTRIDVDSWSDDAAWQEGHEGKTARWYSTNHLMGEGYWVWLIPLASGATSVGIVADPSIHPISEFNSMEKALRWLHVHEPQCAGVVEQNLDKLQDFLAIKRYATECKQVFSRDRWGIVGEAGFFHDPFYSPGSDFIAFANTFLGDLVKRDMNGEGIRIRSFSYDRIFKRFYYGTLAAYQDQYPMFGNSIVMPVKVLWDYMIYWSLTAFIQMQQQTCRHGMYMRNLSSLTRFGNLNHDMQAFFRRWHQATMNQQVSGYVDISQIPLVREMNQQLVEPLTNGQFTQRFSRNLAQLETIAREIVSHADIGEELPRYRSRKQVRSGGFDPVLKIPSAADQQPTAELTEAQSHPIAG